MNTTRGKNEKRFQFLNRLYEKTGGDESEPCDLYEIGKELGFDEDSIVKIGYDLYGTGLIKHSPECGTRNKTIWISHKGVLAVESPKNTIIAKYQYLGPVGGILKGATIIVLAYIVLKIIGMSGD